jgi:hypothetical protein
VRTLALYVNITGSQCCHIECCGVLSDNCRILCYLHIILLACFPLFRKKCAIVLLFSLCLCTYVSSIFNCRKKWSFFFRNLSLKQLETTTTSINGAFAKLREAIINFVMSVCPHGTTRLPLDGFSWNMILKYFSKICREIQVSLKSYKNYRYFSWRPIYTLLMVAPCINNISVMAAYDTITLTTSISTSIVEPYL